MVMHSGMRNVRRHDFNGLSFADLQKAFFSGGIELQQSRAELKTLRPLRPSARSVFSFDREYWRSFCRVPGFFQAENLWRGNVEQPVQFRQKFFRRCFEVERWAAFREAGAMRLQFHQSLE